MNKITIDLEDLKNYLRTLPTKREEWYDDTWALHAQGISEYVATINKDFAEELFEFSQNYSDELEAKYEERNMTVEASIEALRLEKEHREFGVAPIKTESESWGY